MHETEGTARWQGGVVVDTSGPPRPPNGSVVTHCHRRAPRRFKGCSIMLSMRWRRDCQCDNSGHHIVASVMHNSSDACGNNMYFLGVQMVWNWFTPEQNRIEPVLH